MKKSITPTSYLLIKACNGGNQASIDFALVHLTDSWKTALAARLRTVSVFDADESFHNLSYWESPMGYYANPIHCYFTEEIMDVDEDWIFVTLEANEEKTFPAAVEELEWHQFVITSHGLANFIAFSTRTNNEYWTEWFSISEVLGKMGIPNGMSG